MVCSLACSIHNTGEDLPSGLDQFLSGSSKRSTGADLAKAKTSFSLACMPLEETLFSAQAQAASALIVGKFIV